MDKKKQQTVVKSNRSPKAKAGRTGLSSSKKPQQIDQESQKTSTEKNFFLSSNAKIASSSKKKQKSDSTFLKESNQKSNYTPGDKNLQTLMTEKKQHQHNIQRFDPDARLSSLEAKQVDKDTNNRYASIGIGLGSQQSRQGDRIGRNTNHYGIPKQNSLQDSKTDLHKQQPHLILKKKKDYVRASMDSLQMQPGQENFEQKVSATGSLNQSPKKNMSYIQESFKPTGMIPREPTIDYISKTSLNDESQQVIQAIDPSDSFQNLDQRFTFGDLKNSVGQPFLSIGETSSPSKNQSYFRRDSNLTNQKQIITPQRRVNGHQPSSGQRLPASQMQTEMLNKSLEVIDPTNNKSNKWTTSSMKKNQIKESREMMPYGLDKQTGKPMNSRLATQQIQKNQKLGMVYQQQPEVSDIRAQLTNEQSSVFSSPKKDEVESITDRQLANYKEGIENNFTSSPTKYIMSDQQKKEKSLNGPGQFKNSDAYRQQHDNGTNSSLISYQNSNISATYKSQKPPIKNSFANRGNSQKNQDQYDKEVSKSLRRLQDIAAKKRADYYSNQPVHSQQSQHDNNDSTLLMSKPPSIAANSVNIVSQNQGQRNSVQVVPLDKLKMQNTNNGSKLTGTSKIIKANHDLRNVQKTPKYQDELQMKTQSSQGKVNQSQKVPLSGSHVKNSYQSRGQSVNYLKPRGNSVFVKKENGANPGQNNNSHNYLRKLKMDYKIKDSNRTSSRPQSVQQPTQTQKVAPVYRASKVSFVSNRQSEDNHQFKEDSAIPLNGSRNARVNQLERQSFVTNSINHFRPDQQFASNFTSFNRSDMLQSDQPIIPYNYHQNSFVQSNKGQEPPSPNSNTLQVPGKLISFNSQIYGEVKKEKEPEVSTKKNLKKQKSNPKMSNEKKSTTKKNRKNSKDKSLTRSKSPNLQSSGKIDGQALGASGSSNYYKRKMKQYKIERTDSKGNISDQRRSISATSLPRIDSRNGERLQNKQNYMYTQSDNESLDIKNLTGNTFPSKMGSIASPNNQLYSSKQSDFIKNGLKDAQKLKGPASNVTSPKSLKKKSRLISIEKETENQTRNKEVLSPKIIDQQSISFSNNQNNSKSQDTRKLQKTVQKKYQNYTGSLIYKKQKSGTNPDNSEIKGAYDSAQPKQTPERTRSQSKLKQPSQLNQSMHETYGKGKTPIDMAYEELNMTQNQNTRKRESIKPFKSSNYLTQKGTKLYGKSPSKSVGRASYVSANSRTSQVQQHMAFNQKQYNSHQPQKNQSNDSKSRKNTPDSRTKNISEIQIDINDCIREQEQIQDQAQSNYIHDTGINNFKLVKGDALIQSRSINHTNESPRDLQSPPKMIKITNFVETLKKEEKNEDEVTITERTNNSALPSVRKQIKNIVGLKMLKGQLRHNNSNSIASNLSPYNLGTAKDSTFVPPDDEFTDRGLSEVQQENSEGQSPIGDGDCGSASMIASVQSISMGTNQQQFLQHPNLDSSYQYGNLSNTSAIDFNGNQSASGYAKRRINMMSDSSQSNITGHSGFSQQRKLTIEQQKYIEQINNSNLAISNNPSSCQRDNNSVNFNDAQFFQQQIQRTHSKNSFFMSQFQDKVSPGGIQESAGGNPFDQPMILNPADIGADYFDSQSRQKNQAPQINTNQFTDSKENSSRDSEDPQYLADLNLFMNSTKEKSEDELLRIEKRLNEVQENVKNIQYQIKEQSQTKNPEDLHQSRFFQNLLSLLDHHLHQHNYLVQRHQTVRQDIVKLAKYQEEQKRIAEEKRQEEERFRQFYQRRLAKQQSQMQSSGNNTSQKNRQYGVHTNKQSIEIKANNHFSGGISPNPLSETNSQNNKSVISLQSKNFISPKSQSQGMKMKK